MSGFSWEPEVNHKLLDSAGREWESVPRVGEVRLKGWSREVVVLGSATWEREGRLEDWRSDPGKVRDKVDTRSDGVNSLTGVGTGASSRRDGKWVGGRRGGGRRGGGCSAGPVDVCGCGRFTTGDSRDTRD